MPFKFSMGDITKYEGDAILNSLGPNGRVYGSLCKSIITASNNADIKNYIDSIENAKATTIYMTEAGDLPCKKIIHVVTPYKSNDPDNKLLLSCYQEALRIAIENGFKSICLPLIGSKASGYSQEEAYNAMIEACSEIDISEEQQNKEIISITGLTYLNKRPHQYRPISKEFNMDDSDERSYNDLSSKMYSSRKYEAREYEDNGYVSYKQSFKAEKNLDIEVIESLRKEERQPREYKKAPKHVLFKMCKAFSQVNPDDSVPLFFDAFKEHLEWDLNCPYLFLEYLIERKGQNVHNVLFPECDSADRKKFKKVHSLNNKDIIQLACIAKLSKTELLEFMAYCGNSFSPRSMIDRAIIKALKLWPFEKLEDLRGFIEDETDGIDINFEKLTPRDEKLDCAWLTPKERYELLQDRTIY